MTRYSREELQSVPYSDLQKIIDKVRKSIKQSDTIKDLFEEYNVSIDELDLIPMCFDDLEVSARTEHGIISFNYSLITDDDFENADHYMAHEVRHFLQQTTGDGPTKGSTDDDYLDNKYEKEGFQAQTKYLSETRSDEEAEEYVEKVLNHHEISNKEWDKKKDQLLDLAQKQPKMSRFARLQIMYQILNNIRD